jgi:hypothetical protein
MTFPGYTRCADGLLRKRVTFDGALISESQRTDGGHTALRLVRLPSGKFVREEKVTDHSCPKCVLKPQLN